MKHIIKNYLRCLFAALFIMNSLAIDFACADEDEVMTTASKCILAGYCDDFVKCPMNRACFYNCDIGWFPEGMALHVGNFFAGIIGLDKLAETNYQVICRNNCVASLVDDCKKPQPIDVTTSELSDNPAKLCRTYCGMYPDGKTVYGNCSDTCRNFDGLNECYQANKDNPAFGAMEIDPKTKKLVCDPNEYFGAAEQFMHNKQNVNDKMRSFAQEAACQIKPSLPYCGATLCNNYPWSRSCEAHQQRLRAKMLEDKKWLEDYLVESSKRAQQEMEKTKKASEAYDKAQEGTSERLKALKEGKVLLPGGEEK